MCKQYKAKFSITSEIDIRQLATRRGGHLSLNAIEMLAYQDRYTLISTVPYALTIASKNAESRVTGNNTVGNWSESQASETEIKSTLCDQSRISSSLSLLQMLRALKCTLFRLASKSTPVRTGSLGGFRKAPLNPDLGNLRCYASSLRFQ